IGGVFPGFGYDLFLPEPIYHLYRLSQEGFAAAVLAMVGMALWRRLTHRVPRLEGAETHPNDPLLILSWIAALMITMFGADYAPQPSLLHSAMWWSHALLVLGFLNYLPYSKHLH